MNITKYIEEQQKKAKDDLRDYMNASIAYCALQTDPEKMAVSAEDEIEWVGEKIKEVIENTTRHILTKQIEEIEGNRQNVANPLSRDDEIVQIGWNAALDNVLSLLKQNHLVIYPLDIKKGV